MDKKVFTQLSSHKRVGLLGWIQITWVGFAGPLLEQLYQVRFAPALSSSRVFFFLFSRTERQTTPFWGPLAAAALSLSALETPLLQLVRPLLTPAHNSAKKLSPFPF